MFKSARWRSEKNKIKSVFKLQFHATQLKQLAGDTLIISVIPADIRKPTVRLEKAKVKDGSCYWEKPHHQTVNFCRDPKNGKFDEKIYHFLISTGSSKSSGVGEVSIDFASFAQATKISSLTLPLRNGDSASFLHVSIQRVQESSDPRDVDETEKANRQDRSLRAQLSNSDMEESIQSNLDEDFGSLRDNMESDRRASIGSDITLSGSESSSGLDTPLEQEPKKTKATHEPTIYEERHERTSQWDWLDGSPPEPSTDEYSPGPEEPLFEDVSKECSPDDVIKELKRELDIMARQADVAKLELQTLRKQIVKERKKGKDLSKEVDALVEERNTFKEDIEKLKAYQKCTGEAKAKVNNKLSIEGGDPWALVGELRQELNYEKDLNSNLRLQLQKTQESNAELILAVKDLDEMLEQKDSRSKCYKACESQGIKSETDDDDDEDQKALEEIVREHSGMQDGYLLEQKITDLHGEIEIYKRDKDMLEMQIEQIALDNEILKQGNHDMSCKLEQSHIQEQLKMQYECASYAVVNQLEEQIESLDFELQMKCKELSESVLALEELETHVKKLEKDIEDQAQGFEADLEDLMETKVKQEQRAICAEENLRKMRMQNANTAERLQEEFRRLSKQLASSFEANEKVAVKAMDEANQLRAEKRYLEEMVEKLKQDLECMSSEYEEKLIEKARQLEKHIQDLSGCRAEIEKLKSDKQDLEGERKHVENDVHLAKMELESSRKELLKLMDANKQKDGDYERLRSEMECLESRYNDAELSLKENEYEKEKEMERRLEACRGDEVALLKRLNHSMEVELVEMQERYSEISLKFAEVEGERQKLVMSLRNLKNAKRLINPVAVL